MTLPKRIKTITALVDFVEVEHPDSIEIPSKHPISNEPLFCLDFLSAIKGYELLRKVPIVKGK